MNEKERLVHALANKAVDRPPCICPGGMMNMITTELMDACAVYWPQAHTDARMMADLAAESFKSGCFENIGVPFCMTIEAEELGAEVTLGSNIFEPHVTGYAFEDIREWTKLAPIRADAGRAKAVIDAIRLLKAEHPGVPIIGNLTGPISVASSVMDPVAFYKGMKRRNKETHAYMEFITDQIAYFGKLQIEAGVDVIAISDPSGTGEILGPKFFDEFVVTYLNKLLDSLDSAHVPTIVHICGQMKSVYEQVNKVRSDALSFDSIVPIKEAKAHLPGRVIMGNVSTYALEFSTPERIIDMTRVCVQNGSDIISPACGLGTKSPLDNIRAVLTALKGEWA